MCGILAIMGMGRENNAQSFRPVAIKCAKRLRHRGPDWSGMFAEDRVIMAHERLTIVDVLTGAQPQYADDDNLVLTINGEIYNHLQLREQLGDAKFTSNSDCECILHLYQEHRDASFINRLRGMFALVLYDRRQSRYIAARDPIGIIPLYMGFSQDGSVWFSSELKALHNHCQRFTLFPPGHVYDSETGQLTQYYHPEWRTSSLQIENGISGDLGQIDQKLKQSLIDSVKCHLMADVPFGVLLSGGLDSSLICSIACRLVDGGAANVKTFSVGLKDSPDLAAARNVARRLGTHHHEFTFTVQEGVDALSDVVYHTETFDVTSIRASTPMFLMARRIKATGVKMVLSGEGADEIFGGYLYFHKAPSASEFHSELVDKIGMLHQYDCLRANKSMAAFGVEARVPFLDTDFLDTAMSIPAVYKMAKDEITGKARMEKFILRRAFSNDGFLPDDILWRQKEQFSDGVGYHWIDSLKSFAESQVDDAMLNTSKYRFPDKTPLTKEAYLYRQIFESHFPDESSRGSVPWQKSIACSTERALQWDKSFHTMEDPSGRAIVGVHNEAYEMGEMMSQ